MEKKAHFNIIDAVTILLIAAALFSAAFGYFTKSAKSGSDSVIFCLKVTDISPGLAERINEGDNIYNHSDNAPLGKVTSISADPPPGFFADKKDGTLYIEFISEAEKAENGYIVNGTNISTGNSLEIRFPHLYCRAECIGYEKNG